MSGMLQRSWTRLNDETIGVGDRYWHIATQTASFYQDMEPIVRRYARGRLLDMGAGRLSTRTLLRTACEKYVSFDAHPTHAELDVICDIARELPFASGAFDTLYCCSVLEHTRRPWRVFDEMYRILKADGVAILSVPFLFYAHGEPDDYFRFTRHGVEYLAREAGFTVERITMHGGLFHTLCNVGSILTSVCLFTLRMKFLIRPATGVWTAAARLLDRTLDKRSLFANGVIAVLRKPATEGVQA